jgi:4-amino-4-deoxy-L-arabinose transferase-like glycosyltransferase
VIAASSHGDNRFGVPWEALAVALVLLAALLVRLPGLNDPSIEQRENQSSLIARGYYLAGREDIPAWQRRVLDQVDTVLKAYEPPLLELASATFDRATGAERIWFPRLLSTLAWLVGAVCLAFLALRLTNTAGMLTAVGLYVAWPYAFWQSRKFMPDSLLVACILAATLAIVRYWERPTRGRFAAAAAAAAVATVIKPGVGLFFVVAVFVALALAHDRLRAEIVSGRLVVFVGVAASLAVGYFLIGKATGFTQPGAGEGRLMPDYVFERQFWTGWWDMVSFLLTTPQRQTSLALLPLTLGILGLTLTPRGAPRAILWGLATGYVVFGLAFARYTSTHPYYALMLIPILALALGVVVGRLWDALARSTPARAALGFVVVAVVVVGTYKAYVSISGPNETVQQRIADYRRIGELTDHTTRAIIVNPSLGHPVMYWGWIVGQEWDLGQPTLPSAIDPAEKDYLIVVDNGSFDASPGLREFARGRRVVERTDRVTVFALRDTDEPRS